MYYEKDFEEIMLKETAAYYSIKASNWIVEDSCPDYILKAEECLRKEKDRVSHYLYPSSESKLLEIVQNELLVKYAKQLLENEELIWIHRFTDGRCLMARLKNFRGCIGFSTKSRKGWN